MTHGVLSHFIFGLVLQLFLPERHLVVAKDAITPQAAELKQQQRPGSPSGKEYPFTGVPLVVSDGPTFEFDKQTWAFIKPNCGELVKCVELDHDYDLSATEAAGDDGQAKAPSTGDDAKKGGSKIVPRQTPEEVRPEAPWVDIQHPPEWTVSRWRWTFRHRMGADRRSPNQRKGLYFYQAVPVSINIDRRPSFQMSKLFEWVGESMRNVQKPEDFWMATPTDSLYSVELNHIISPYLLYTLLRMAEMELGKPNEPLYRAEGTRLLVHAKSYEEFRASWTKTVSDSGGRIGDAVNAIGDREREVPNVYGGDRRLAYLWEKMTIEGLREDLRLAEADRLTEREDLKGPGTTRSYRPIRGDGDIHHWADHVFDWKIMTRSEATGLLFLLGARQEQYEAVATRLKITWLRARSYVERSLENAPVEEQDRAKADTIMSKLNWAWILNAQNRAMVALHVALGSNTLLPEEDFSDRYHAIMKLKPDHPDKDSSDEDSPNNPEKDDPQEADPQEDDSRENYLESPLYILANAVSQGSSLSQEVKDMLKKLHDDSALILKQERLSKETLDGATALYQATDPDDPQLEAALDAFMDLSFSECPKDSIPKESKTLKPAVGGQTHSMAQSNAGYLEGALTTLRQATSTGGSLSEEEKAQIAKLHLATSPDRLDIIPPEMRAATVASHQATFPGHLQQEKVEAVFKDLHRLVQSNTGYLEGALTTLRQATSRGGSLSEEEKAQIAKLHLATSPDTLDIIPPEMKAATVALHQATFPGHLQQEKVEAAFKDLHRLELWLASLLKEEREPLALQQEEPVALQKEEPGASQKEEPGASQKEEPGALQKEEPGTLQKEEPRALQRAISWKCLLSEEARVQLTGSYPDGSLPEDVLAALAVLRQATLPKEVKAAAEDTAGPVVGSTPVAIETPEPNRQRQGRDQNQKQADAVGAAPVETVAPVNAAAPVVEPEPAAMTQLSKGQRKRLNQKNRRMGNTPG